MAMRTQLMLVTPLLAKNWMKRNTDNRAIRRSRVAYLSRLIKRGEWKTTHQGIAFDKAGILLDGQHRLLAIIDADIAVMMMVTHDADRDTFHAIDGARPRTPADILKVPQKVSEVVRTVAKITTGNHVPTPGELQEVYEVVGDSIEELLKACPSHTKHFSSAPVKTAAVTAMLESGNAEYVKKVYSDLVNARIGELPAIGQVFVTQSIKGVLDTNDDNDLMARAFQVFDPKNASHTRIQVKDATLARDRVRDFYRNLMQ
jgi:hypothetical protein